MDDCIKILCPTMGCSILGRIQMMRNLRTFEKDYTMLLKKYIREQDTSNEFENYVYSLALIEVIFLTIKSKSLESASEFVVIQNEIKKYEEEFGADTCPVCLDKMLINIECNNKHQFHLRCAIKWSEESDSCPMCRDVIN